MKTGLLKINCKIPTSLSVPAYYVNRPKTHGITIAFGTISDDLLNLVGESARVCLNALYSTKNTMFFGANFEFLPEPEVAPVPPNPPHITVGWAKGSAPVVAGQELGSITIASEMPRGWRRSMEFEGWTTVGVVEFLEFKDSKFG